MEAEGVVSLVPLAVGLALLAASLAFFYAEALQKGQALELQRRALREAEGVVHANAGVLSVGALNAHPSVRDERFAIGLELMDLEANQSWTSGEGGVFSAVTSLPVLVRRNDGTEGVGRLIARVRKT